MALTSDGIGEHYFLVQWLSLPTICRGGSILYAYLPTLFADILQVYNRHYQFGLILRLLFTASEIQKPSTERWSRKGATHSTSCGSRNIVSQPSRRFVSSLDALLRPECCRICWIEVMNGRQCAVTDVAGASHTQRRLSYRCSMTACRSTLLDERHG